MLNAIVADLLILLHLGFILFVVLGGLLVLRLPRLAWLHLPAVAWGALVEFSGQAICPLTELENDLRQAAGNGYPGGFIDHYLVPLIYPPGLTRGMQVGLGIGVVALNALVYAALAARRRRARRRGG